MRQSRIASPQSPFASRTRLRRAVLGVCMAALVTACGGGGDEAPASRSRPAQANFASHVPPMATARVQNLDADLADVLVALANQGAENWASAQVASASMLGAGALNTAAFSGTGDAGAQEGTALCGSGSVAVQAEEAFIARMLRSQGRDWQADDRVNLEFRRCVIDDGSLGLAQLPDGYTLSGSVQVSVQRYNSASHYAATLTLTGVRLVSPGGATHLALDAARYTVDYSPQALHTVLDTGTQAYIDGQVSLQGQVAVISAGIWRTTPPAQAHGLTGWLDIDYSGWRFDRAQQRARAGSVQVLGAAGVIATVAAQDDGSYTVTLTGQPGNPPSVFACAAQQACESAAL